MTNDQTRAASLEALDASRDLFMEMISSMREGIIIVGQGNRVIASNPTARKMFEQDLEIKFRPLDEIIDDKDIHAAFDNALRKRSQSEMQVEIVVDRDKRVYNLRVAPVNYTATPSAIGIFNDVTRIERLERVRQEFLSNVSHELRTPLTSILAFCETLSEGGLDDSENNRRFVDIIRRNAERMHHLINDILELSAIEAGKTEVVPKRFSLAPLVNEVWTSLAEKSQTGLTLVFRNEVQPDVDIYADPRRVEQILTNLVSNAIKFNRPFGTITVSYELKSGHHEIRVADTGEGIAEQHLPRIFERFYRADNARSRELGGTGLGLAIVKHLSRLHGGEVRVMSTLGEGTTFIIELPVGR
jgi:two-component system phosphate regulon sensor histidine kinase PhoR